MRFSVFFRAHPHSHARGDKSGCFTRQVFWLTSLRSFPAGEPNHLPGAATPVACRFGSYSITAAGPRGSCTPLPIRTAFRSNLSGPYGTDETYDNGMLSYKEIADTCQAACPACRSFFAPARQSGFGRRAAGNFPLAPQAVLPFNRMIVKAAMERKAVRFCHGPATVNAPSGASVRYVPLLDQSADRGLCKTGCRPVSRFVTMSVLRGSGLRIAVLGRKYGVPEPIERSGFFLLFFAGTDSSRTATRIGCKNSFRLWNRRGESR